MVIKEVAFRPGIKERLTALIDLIKGLYMISSMQFELIAFLYRASFESSYCMFINGFLLSSRVLCSPGGALPPNHF
jgi:hypothetical protein